jgi:hypothetical protein
MAFWVITHTLVDRNKFPPSWKTLKLKVVTASLPRGQQYQYTVTVWKSTGEVSDRQQTRPVSQNKRRCHENSCVWACVRAREPTKRHSRSLSGGPLSCLPNKSSCRSSDHHRSPVLQWVREWGGERASERERERERVNRRAKTVVSTLTKHDFISKL